MASLGCLFLVSLLSAPFGVRAEDARIAPASEVTELELNSLMHLELTAPETEALRLTYSVYPLTEPAGLNRSDRSSIWFRGSLVPAEVLADARLMNEETIVFFSCDGEDATVMVNQIMGDQPQAILLYSVDGTSCSLEGDDLVYNSIYTMGNPNEARDTMNTTVRAGGVLRATITGAENMTTRPEPDNPGQRGSNSAVAMSILYSITGLITLLFLVIIGTGAIRAHRYPERYGPLSGAGGRPSQSRVKGLARAVLETLPIVKFGDPGPSKSLELESQHSATAPDPTMGTRLSAIPEEPQSPQARRSVAPMSGAMPKPEVVPAPTSNETDQKDGNKPAESPEEGHLGCSICTEDFTLGEDVRVLPCNHKFHPPCIDPWLVNISGTCPLCRLDLHPQSRRARNSSHSSSSPPSSPTTATANQNEHDNTNTTNTTTTANTNTTTTITTTTTPQQRRRSFRFLDLHRLRHASSIEERIEILRRHRSHQQQQQQQQQQHQQHQQHQQQREPNTAPADGTDPAGVAPPRAPSWRVSFSRVGAPRDTGAAGEGGGGAGEGTTAEGTGEGTGERAGERAGEGTAPDTAAGERRGS
ncbi:uncharacterized protein B0H64DRAFT_419165 [Chaetomium fimeti]|uniref:RING-type E3 ubiquitin transferase n=1 Tax=Chaetomium fimeti TaxID=1854472 RepID=A0AAE0LQ79_9PEZI|nr:hypothetical protein B0H64DRAFT_419165 [Chaetomium fimeti]